MLKNNHNSISRQMVIGVTMGDAAGIGPEVVVKALADPEVRRAAKFIVFGMNEQDGIALAYHLGRALQLTNILRDIDEDAGLGRLYLPREALDAAGIASSDPMTVAAHPGLDPAGRVVAQRARNHFIEAEAIMARSPRRAVKAPRIMGKAYRRILDTMEARGFNPPRQRVRISKRHLIGIALRYAFI